MSMQKQKLTVKAARGASNSRHERNRIRGTVIIISTEFAYCVSSSLFERLIYVSRKGCVCSLREGVRTTGETLVQIAEVHECNGIFL
jgi:hypothetical protein